MKKFRDVFLDNVIACERKIMSIEVFLGVSAIDVEDMNKKKYMEDDGQHERA